MSDKKQAAKSLAQFEAHLRLIERGIVDPPGADTEVGVYIESGGKLSSRPTQGAKVERVTYGSLLDSYLAGFPREAKEAGRQAGPLKRSIQSQCQSFLKSKSKWNFH